MDVSRNFKEFCEVCSDVVRGFSRCKYFRAFIFVFKGMIIVQVGLFRLAPS